MPTSKTSPRQLGTLHSPNWVLTTGEHLRWPCSFSPQWRPLVTVEWLSPLRKPWVSTHLQTFQSCIQYILYMYSTCVNMQKGKWSFVYIINSNTISNKNITAPPSFLIPFHTSVMTWNRDRWWVGLQFASTRDMVAVISCTVDSTALTTYMYIHVCTQCTKH